MATNRPSYSSNPEPPTTNGWTQYQKLVLAELERHDESLNKLYDEMTLLKLGQGKISSDITKYAEQSQRDLEVLKVSLNKEGDALKDARIELSKAKDDIAAQKLSIGSINVKIGAAIACISMVGSAVVSTLFKFFFLQ